MATRLKVITKVEVDTDLFSDKMLGLMIFERTALLEYTKLEINKAIISGICGLPLQDMQKDILKAVGITITKPEGEVVKFEEVKGGKL